VLICKLYVFVFWMEGLKSGTHVLLHHYHGSYQGDFSIRIIAHFGIYFIVYNVLMFAVMCCNLQLIANGEVGSKHCCISYLFLGKVTVHR